MPCGIVRVAPANFTRYGYLTMANLPPAFCRRHFSSLGYFPSSTGNSGSRATMPCGIV
jgi:hypothetical protein